MHDFPDTRSWRAKFADALRGVKLGVRGQSSFFAHFFIAAAVVAAGVSMNCSLVEWCLLALCITAVLVAEMFNSAIEALAKAVTREFDQQIGAALDIGSAAVLLTSIGASVVGGIIFGNRLGQLLGWW
ncbi:MAG: diacylglycerol kinase [Pirellulales bacterium]